MNPVYIALGERNMDQHIMNRIISFISCPMVKDIKDIISIFVCKKKIEDRARSSYLNVFTNDYYCFLEDLIKDYIPYRARGIVWQASMNHNSYSVSSCSIK